MKLPYENLKRAGFKFCLSKSEFILFALPVLTAVTLAVTSVIFASSPVSL